jgi:hypothetical protein
MGEEKYKFNIGDVVLGRVIVGRFIGDNIFGRQTKMYEYKFIGETEDLPPILCSEETLIRKNY